MATYKTPGVYIEEINAFPGSVVEVATAIPAFIGFTERATKNGKSLENIPTRITSFKEFEQFFGGPQKLKFSIDNIKANKAIDVGKITLKENEKRAYLFDSLQLFYANGGGACWVVSVGNYDDIITATAKKLTDPIADNNSALDKETEPTMLVIPDALSLDSASCYKVYGSMLQHCERMKNRVGIYDVYEGNKSDALDNDFESFRSGMGSKTLDYSAAYYPWVNTSIIASSTVNFDYIDGGHAALAKVLSEGELAIYNKLKGNFEATKIPSGNTTKGESSKKEGNSKTKIENQPVDKETADRNLHNGLLTNSPSYKMIINEIANQLNIMPTAAMMAGVYTSVDNSRGVWKAPANISLASVVSPTVNITHDQQEKMNVDANTGKSINALRSFPGLGTLVWGARTLDGNSLDWTYINVRRTMIMLEQSIKMALRGYVFEPNTASTWITVKNMISNYLTEVWKKGGLAGAIPSDAYDVQVGLGSTMTSTDILEGKMIITVKVAISRPAEFIVVRFQQQMQKS